MKIFFLLFASLTLLGCKNTSRQKVATAATHTDSSSYQIIKGPSYLSSLQFSKNYPTHETANKIYNAISFQRACQAYLLSFPMVVRSDHQSLPPAGFPYWQSLSNIVNGPSWHQGDPSLVNMIQTFGIEKGKLFQPSLQEKIILTDAAEIGFRMVQVIALRHVDSSRMYGATKWKQPSHAASKAESDALSNDEQVSMAFEKISLSNETNDPSKASAYLFSAEDKDGQWLDGAQYYQLHIPKNIPARKSWSLTVYDNTTWQVIHNNEPRSSFNSKQPTYLANADGSVDVFFGPVAPAGEGTNWIRTLPDRGWFAYLKLSDPTINFHNKSWPLGDIEEVSEKVWKGVYNGQ